MPWIAYFPENARSECVAPSTFSVGGVVEISFRFQAACPASQTPAARPTRGSGDGAVSEMTGATGAGIDAGGGGSGGGGVRVCPGVPAGGCAGA